MSASDASPTSPSAVEFGQRGRLLELRTVLGPDRLLPTSLAGDEAISRPFRFDLELMSDDQAIRPEVLVGTAVALRMMPADGSPRLLHGYVSRFSSSAPLVRQMRTYRMEVVPWLWFLTRTADCRIFQHKTIPAIIKDVFDDLAFTDYEFRLYRHDYPQLDFCAQYRETAFNFVSRLMEDAGIFYFFRHEETKHTLVVADSNSFFTNLDKPNLAFADGERAAGFGGLITRWEHDWTFITGRVAQTDFNFETPSSGLLVSEKTVLDFPQASSFERFDYPGCYTDSQHGRQRTRTLMEAEEAQYHLVRGASTVPALGPGQKLLLASHAIREEADSGPYVILKVRHEARDSSYLVGLPDTTHYENTFEAIDAKVPYRTPCLTPKPFVQGPQTATVVGPPGEKIHTDKHGRVKLQFHWDRRGKRDDKSSCWVRVSQNSAGAGWGGVLLPHVGHEVVVSFLEGDPDRPLVTGRVYNGSNGSSIGMPANKTQSGLRDHSGNEILMEGKGGSQDVRVTAVKDMNIKVVNDRNHVVDKNETLQIGANQSQTIQGHRTETVNAGETVTVNSGRNHTVNGIQQTTISLAETHTVGAGRMHNVGAAESITVGGLQMVNVGAAHLLTVGAAQVVTVTGPRKVSASAISESAKGPIKIKAGAVCVIEATSITLKAGGSEIVMSSSGITLKGTKIVHKADDNITLNAGSGVKVKGGSIGEN